MILKSYERKGNKIMRNRVLMVKLILLYIEKFGGLMGVLIGVVVDLFVKEVCFDILSFDEIVLFLFSSDFFDLYKLFVLLSFCFFYLFFVYLLILVCWIFGLEGKEWLEFEVDFFLVIFCLSFVNIYWEF